MDYLSLFRGVLYAAGVVGSIAMVGRLVPLLCSYKDSKLAWVLVLLLIAWTVGCLFLLSLVLWPLVTDVPIPDHVHDTVRTFTALILGIVPIALYIGVSNGHSD